ncbi:MAG: GntR family transcriptional regulator [Acidobacteriota bacterium]
MSSPASNRLARKRPAAPPLTDRAYLAIKAEILSNRLEPGAVLPIQRFTGEMKLSRTPVREAILRLQKEGFLEVRPRLGTIVAHLDLRRLREMYHLRSVLEGEAAKLACRHIPGAALEECERELRRPRTAGALDIPAMSEAGQRLHETIIANCGNTLLMETIRGLQDHFVRFRHVSLRLPEKVLASHHEHIAILGALKRKDGDAAQRLVREHFEHAAHFLIDSLLNQPLRRDQPAAELHAVR